MSPQQSRRVDAALDQLRALQRPNPNRPVLLDTRAAPRGWRIWSRRSRQPRSSRPTRNSAKLGKIRYDTCCGRSRCTNSSKRAGNASSGRLRSAAVDSSRVDRGSVVADLRFENVVGVVADPGDQPPKLHREIRAKRRVPVGDLRGHGRCHGPFHQPVSHQGAQILRESIFSLIPPIFALSSENRCGPATSDARISVAQRLVTWSTMLTMYSDAGYRALDTAGRIGWRW
jgi:hypothetical protein